MMTLSTMKGHLAATVCLVLLVCATSAASTPLNKWGEHVYDDDGFAISAPTQPIVEKGPANSPAGEVELHFYSFSLGGDSGFVVMTNTLNPADHRTPQQILTDGKYGAVAAVKGKLVSEMPISLGNYPGIQLEVEAPRRYIQARVYVVGRRVYQLLAVAPIGKPIPPETDRFFRSFRLVASSR